jgi:hypothetical protein
MMSCEYSTVLCKGEARKREDGLKKKMLHSPGSYNLESTTAGRGTIMIEEKDASLRYPGS